ncbi:SRPBCC family protein [Kitasatospora sp. RB6PN24]|uniref:SRPBCC family protein n=1 Tax=Kitasatospora humi TaxID=2893891 RepID=UPI001E3D16C4|nr:SRPBCC family protein [Kitasatospora humi]MCC9309565.1 SRPBCC family protein [Kitasatospora humi]
MTEYERTRTMPALPELVFDEAADTGRLDAWMPRDLHVRVDDPPAVTVHEDRSGADERGLLRALRDQRRMEWGTRDDGRYAGWLQVAGMGAGASQVTIHLSFFGGTSAPTREAVEQGLDESLARLEEQVRLRVENSG